MGIRVGKVASASGQRVAETATSPQYNGLHAVPGLAQHLALR